MPTPPTFADAVARNLVTADGAGIYTFSNGSEWEGWASGNCYDCAYYPMEGPAGAHCAFECAAFLHIVSPDLAKLFGWLPHPKYATSWERPDACPFFRKRDDGDDHEGRPTPSDPAQLVLLADPTEDAAAFVSSPSTVPQYVVLAGATPEGE